MKPILIILLIVGGVILAITAGGAISDASNLDVIAPMPTPYHDDITSDILTISEPITITGEVREVAIVDEITDLARDVSSNQLEQAKDSNQAIAAVAVTGYATIGAIEAGHTVRDIAVIAGLVLVAIFISKARKDEKHG